MPIQLAFFLVHYWADTTWRQTRTTLPVDPTTHRIRYTALVPVAGRRQTDLLAAARTWFLEIGRPDKPAVLTSTLGTDVLVAYGTQPFAYTYRYAPTTEATTTPQHYTIRLVLHYTATLLLQQGRYTYQVTDFEFEYPTATPPSPTRLPAEDDLLHVRAINERGASMITAERASFQEAMGKLLAQLQKQMSTPLPQAGTE
jgi:hypothetical protein